MTRTIPILALALAALAGPSLAQDATTAEAQADASTSQGGTGALVNADGATLGNVTVSITASGAALVVVEAEGIPEGIHGVHLHMVGACDGPTFETAGEHVAGDHDHGIMVDSGPHAGDLPNAHVGSDGVISFEAFAVGLTTDMLFDEDGSALIVHSAPDDYTTQPSGDAGDRIACAIIEPGGDMAEPDASNG